MQFRKKCEEREGRNHAKFLKLKRLEKRKKVVRLYEYEMYVISTNFSIKLCKCYEEYHILLSVDYPSTLNNLSFSFPIKTYILNSFLTSCLQFFTLQSHITYVFTSQPLLRAGPKPFGHIKSITTLANHQVSFISNIIIKQQAKLC